MLRGAMSVKRRKKSQQPFLPSAQIFSPFSFAFYLFSVPVIYF